MIRQNQTIFQADEQAKKLFYGFGIITLISLFASILTEQYFLVAIPGVLLIIYLTIFDFRVVYFLLLFCIPLSTEIYLPNGLGTDLPTEPLIVGLMLVYVLYLFGYSRHIGSAFFRHPITLLIFLHLGWVLITTLFSSLTLVSIKFFLAKTWYIITFYFLTGLLIKRYEDVKRIFWIIFIPLMLTVIVTLLRHAFYNFSFEYVHKVLHPFYRNHVNYAAIITVFFPLVWFVKMWYPSKTRKGRILIIALIILIVAIQLSYTRAAYVSLVIALGAYFVIRLKVTRVVLLASLIGVSGLVLNLASKNNFLDFAPNFETTVTHKQFNSLIEATYQGEDISTMERVYRWVAAGYMIQDKPWFGFGPGNFYNFYKSYTLTSFRTYVSDNPEQSGIHSYYLMILVEQGWPGLLFFLMLIAFVLLRGEFLYHQLTEPRQKQIVMMLLLSTIIILSLCIINDLIETDKIGSFFFINLAILVNMDLYRKKTPSNK